MRGLLDSITPNSEVVNMLSANSGQYTWVAAAIGSQNASGYQLATGLPVMAIGGFNGSDPSPTLDQFKTYVSEGKIHYFIAGEGGPGMGGPGGGMGGSQTGGSNYSSEISSWVQENFQSLTVDGTTFYDLTNPIVGTN